MTRGSARRRGAVAALAAASVLLVAGVVTVTAPTDDEVQTPLALVGGLGDTVTSRQTQVTVHGVVVAEQLAFEQPDAPDSTTEGAWVAIDLTTVCRLTSCSFSRSELRIGGRAFAPATLAPFPSFIVQSPAAGLPYRSTALFEVPRDALGDGPAELVLQIAETTALDSVAVVRFDLPEETVPVADVRPPELEGGAT